MVAFFFTSHSSLSSCNLHTQHHKKKHGFNNVGSSLSTIIKNTQSSNRRNPLDFSVNRRYLPLSRRLKPLKSSVKDEQETEPTSSSSVVEASEEPSDEKHTPKSVQGVELSEANEETEGKEDQQEMDWKTDEEFEKFMGNPSIETTIKLEKKRDDRKLKELDRKSSDNPIVGLFNKLVRGNLTREKERLEQAEQTFKVLDLNKMFEGLEMGEFSLGT